MLSVSRVQWFRLSAKATRWREEVEIVEEEMRRTQRFFYNLHSSWHSKSQIAGGEIISRGRAAYAAR